MSPRRHSRRKSRSRSQSERSRRGRKHRSRTRSRRSHDSRGSSSGKHKSRHDRRASRSRSTRWSRSTRSRSYQSESYPPARLDHTFPSTRASRSPLTNTPQTPPGSQDSEVALEIDNPELARELLQALGEDTPPTSDSYDLAEVLQVRWEKILSSGLDRENRNNLMEKNILPTNLPQLTAPVLNAEVKKAVSVNISKRDRYLETNQNQLGKGISALGKAMTLLINNKEENRNNILANLSEAAKLLTDVHYNTSIHRRFLLSPSLNKSVRDVTTKMPITDLLFGHNLSEKIKEVKAVEKSATDLKLLVPKTNFQENRKPTQTNLNWKGPSTFRRESNHRTGYRSYRTQQYPQRNVKSNQRRQT